MKFSYVLLCLAALAASPVFAESTRQVDPVVRTGDNVRVGESTLIRTPNRVQAVVRTSDLDPGSAVTVWWRIYNRPWQCAMPFACEASDLDNPAVEGSQLHATALVVDDGDGAATVIASLYRTAGVDEYGVKFDQSLAEGHLKGRGLRRPMGAEIELLLASHGRLADPKMIGEDAALEQLLTPGGTRLECEDPAQPTSARTFRCGVIQRVDHIPGG